MKLYPPSRQSWPFETGLEPHFSNCNVHMHHLGLLLKCRLNPQAWRRGRDSAFLASAWWGRCCCSEYQGPRRTARQFILIPDLWHLWHRLCSLHFIPRAWRSPPPHPEPYSSTGPKSDRIHKIQRLLAPLRSEPVEVKHRLPYKFFSELRPSTWFTRVIFQPVLELWSESGQRGFCVV